MEEENLVSVEKAKSCFGRLGWALCAYAMVIVVLQLVAVAIGGVLFAMGVNVLENAWFLWAASFIPQYLVGVPLFLLILRKMPVVEQSQCKLGGGKFWALLLMCFPVMFLGNIIGTFLSGLLSGGTAQNSVETMVSGGNPLILFTVVILAPLVEELVFRKQLLDRCAQYGEKTAMVFSALTFALFHMNLFQFFYAFGMGLIFAYVYLRTRRLRYPVLMHMIINFMGSVVPLWVVSNLDLDALSNLNSQNLDQEMLAAILPGLLIYLAYVVVQLVLVIAGLVIGIVMRKSLTLRPTPEELPREGRVKTVYANVGFILFVVVCVVVFSFNL